MKKTLQDQYLLIKEGKGHKGVFLTEAKREFPHIVRNAATFDEAVASLKTKNIISENVMMVMPAMMDRPKKESYETAFEAFLAEAKKKDEDEKVKAEEKKISKPVEEDLAHNFDYSDEKNPDNMIFDQIMMGYYAEMKDPKNADKTMQELKDIVFKNLQKDPIYYTKDGQFGVKGLGYTTEAPGLGEPKEPKGKYKSSGYGDLKESKEIESEKESEEMLDLKSELMQLGVNAMVVDAIAKSKGIQGLRDRLKEKLKEGEEYYDGDDEEEVKDVRDMSWTKGFTKEEQTLREVIREIINSELEEAYQLVNINPIKSDKERGEGEEKDKYAAFTQDEEKVLKEKGDLLVKPMNGEDRVFISAVRQANLPKIQNPTLKKLLTSDGSYTKGFNLTNPSTGIKQEYWMLDPLDKSIKVYINSKGRVSVYIPISSQKSLKESVEKDLADINKEAEHEVLQNKLAKIDDLIDHRRSKLGKLDEDEDMKALTDKKKVKELEKDIKKLEVARKKVEKMMSKFKGKKKEVIDEVEEDLDVNPEYVEDATERLDDGQSVDSIMSDYSNLGNDQEDDLKPYLNSIAPKNLKSSSDNTY